MEWGEIQIESLKKMFLNSDNITVDKLEEYKNDKKYKIYLFAMPHVCNEAINFITSNLKSEQKLFEITKTKEEDCYDLSEIINNYQRFSDVICTDNIKWQKINNNIIKISNWTNGTVKVMYEEKPTVITSESKVGTKMNINDEYSRLIPLYIAGELYKDDDLSLSTMYMNEFMTNINNYIGNNNDYINQRINSVYRIE